MTGGKFLVVIANKIKVIDSYNFIPVGLAKFGKAFGLTELKKGYFPHKFNIPENQSYIGTIPAKDYFSPEFMGFKDREEFEAMHAKQDGEYNFKNELIT
jgi:hypothetical protein